jgi:electron transport complex protein RnfC
MSKTSFNLLAGVSGPIQDGPDLKAARVPLPEHGVAKVKKKALVGPGILVAEHEDPGVGYMHSPMTGAVATVTDHYIEITSALPKPKKEDEEPPNPPVASKTSLEGLAGADLEKALNALGVSTRGLGKPTLVVNGLNPEPGVTVHEHLLKDEKATVEKGLELIRNFVSPSSVLLVTPQGGEANLAGTTAVPVKPEYPVSVKELAIKAATGKELPSDVAHISVLDLWQIGRVAETGMPVTETVVTVGGVDFKVQVGTPISALLAKAGIKVDDCDTVVLGGPMRGVAVDSLDTPVGKNDYGLFVIPQGAFPPVSDEQCLNCGECVLVCPARIRPNMIGRYAEFKMFEMCRQEHIEACMECGLCSFHCAAGRPLLQFIRLAKAELGIGEMEAMACFITGIEEELAEEAPAEA